MPAEQSEAFELSEWESKWPDTSKQVAEVLDFASSTSAAYERSESLYQRCISYVLGGQDKHVDLDNLHKCILAAVPMIQHKWPNVTLTVLRGELEESQHLDADVVDQAINIAVCLWLGLDCVAQQDGRPKGWPNADTIQHFVLKRSFDDPTEASVGDSIARFPPKFRAARLKDISGIDIESTWYLDQHLRFNDDTRTLKVFMDAAWLQFMCNVLRETRDSPQENPKQASGCDKSTQTSLPSGQSQPGSSEASNGSQGTQPKQSCIEENKNANTSTIEGGTGRGTKASGVR